MLKSYMRASPKNSPKCANLGPSSIPASFDAFCQGSVLRTIITKRHIKLSSS